MVQDEPLFSAEELKANADRKRKLIELIKSEDAILMAGAGCSASLYPSWSNFVSHLDSAAKEINPDFNADKEDFLPFADAVKECLGEDRYYTLIYHTFQPDNEGATHESFHETLCRLPFKAITTTNYDIVLESALNSIKRTSDNSLQFESSMKIRLYEFLQSLNLNSRIPKRVLHIHGKFDIKESIILGGKEYESKYGFALAKNEVDLFDQLQGGELTREEFQQLLLQYGYEWPIKRKILWSILATRRVVFMGFSMDDPYFRRMLDHVKEDLNTYGAENHFLVLRITKSSKDNLIDFAELMKREYGIVTVFYEDEEKSYKGFENFIYELGAAILPQNTVKIAYAEEATAANDEVHGDDHLTEQLFKISGDQDNEN
jgi:hypothetical protein